MKEKINLKQRGMIFFIVLLATGLLSCSKDEPESFDFLFQFTTDTEGWISGFADYPAGEEMFYELAFEHSILPEPLNQNNGALKVAGNNHSDDLFMFVKKKISDLEPNTTYKITFSINFASNVPDGSFGVGGSPGESVYIKAGAVDTEPTTETDEYNWYRMTIDKGNQSQEGADMISLGDFSNDTDQEEYTLKTLTNSESFVVTSDDKGELWIIVGTDSAFEAKTTIYYNSIGVSFTL